MSKQCLAYDIRKMQQSDLQQVVKMEQQIFSQPWREEDFAAGITKDEMLYYVVERNGEILGYCGLHKILEEGDITNVAIKETCRGQGLGYDMIKEVLQRGQEQGITAFTLEVREGNGSAIRLYEKLGFESAGIRKNFYEKPVENAVIMWKYL